MYIFGADGTPYAFANDHGPEDIDELMNIGLKRFQEKPPKKAEISEEERKASFSLVPPATAQVFQVFERIPSPPKTSSYLNKGVGRDFCWVYEAERQQVTVLAAKGEPFEIPSTIARRIARFHLVDGVRGTPNMWRSNEVRELMLMAEPIIEGQLVITGKFKLRTRNGRRGYAGKINGTLTFDPGTHAWTRLRLLADGTAFGSGTYTPNQPKKPYRLLVGLLNTELPEARLVPPEEVVTQNQDTRYRNP